MCDPSLEECSPAWLRRLRAATGSRANNIRRRLAVNVDGQLRSAPLIASEIPRETAEISGSFTQSETEKLVNKINSAVFR